MSDSSTPTLPTQGPARYLLAGGDGFPLQLPGGQFLQLAATLPPLQPTLVADLSVADVAYSMQALLPQGEVWPRYPGSLQSQVVLALAWTWQRLNARANVLLVDAFPRSTTELLPEWEAALGLPDPCLGDDPLMSDRRAQVVARFANTGGQSIPFFVGFAAALGYPITVGEYAPARCGIARCGQRAYGVQWAHVWMVNAPETVIRSAKCGIDTCGTPLRQWGSKVLECEFARLKPAHTIALFSYG